MWVKRVSNSGGIPDMRDKNRENLIQDALNQLDDELILEAEQVREKSVNTTVERGSILKSSTVLHNKRGKQKSSWRYITTLAASVAVFLIAGTIWNEVIVPNQADEGVVEQEAIHENYDYPEGYQSIDSVTSERDKETDELNDEQIHLPNQEVKLESAAAVGELARVKIPAVEVLLAHPEDVEMDMLAFFIYEGRCYVQDRYYQKGLSLVGDYVGTSVGLIDEWTKEDGYVDYAGSIAGAFYEVKGYDPGFMLCMKFDNGAVETFIHNNDISLGKGSELVEDRLHLTSNYEKVTFKMQEEWDTSLQDKNHVLEEYDALIAKFLESFCSHNFVFIKDTPLDVNGMAKYYENEDNYHLTFHTKDGLQFEFILYEDGYTSFRGLNSVCVQVDPEIYEELIEAFKNSP